MNPPEVPTRVPLLNDCAAKPTTGKPLYVAATCWVKAPVPASSTNSLKMLSCIRIALTASAVLLEADQSVVTTSVLLKTTDSFGLTCDRSGWMLPAGAHSVVAEKLAKATASSDASPPASG